MDKHFIITITPCNSTKHWQEVYRLQVDLWGAHVEFLPAGREATSLAQVQLQVCTIPTRYSNSQLGFTLYNPAISIMSTTTYTNLLGHVPTLLQVPKGYVDSVLAALQPVQTVLAAIHYISTSTVTPTPHPPGRKCTRLYLLQGGPTLEFLPPGRQATQVCYTPVQFLPAIPSPDCFLQHFSQISHKYHFYDYFFYSILLRHVPTLLYIPRAYVESVPART